VRPCVRPPTCRTPLSTPTHAFVAQATFSEHLPLKDACAPRGPIAQRIRIRYDTRGDIAWCNARTLLTPHSSSLARPDTRLGGTTLRAPAHIVRCTPPSRNKPESSPAPGGDNSFARRHPGSPPPPFAGRPRTRVHAAGSPLPLCRARSTRIAPPAWPGIRWRAKARASRAAAFCGSAHA
jgi:hypothetical protein